MASERSRRFGTAAAAYERYRPEYPRQVVQLVREYAGHPIRSALEIGAGTGKATRVLVREGIPVTASEPDAVMLDELRIQVPEAKPVLATLEGLPPLGEFDLVFVAAALHWTEPAGRWERIAGLLAPDGVFACCGGAPYLADPEVEAAVHEAQRPWLVDDEPAGPVETADSGMHWPATELIEDAHFDDIRETVVEQRVEIAADDWVGYLSTVSAYLMLSDEDRAAALAAIHRVLPDAVELVADVTVHLARRRA